MSNHNVAVFVFEGPKGRAEVPIEVYRRIEHALAHPDCDLLDADAVEALDQICTVMDVEGFTLGDGP